jgi:hypothetical protein
MLHVREHTNDVLVLGISRPQELCHLFVVVAGLFAFGLALALGTGERIQKDYLLAGVVCLLGSFVAGIPVFGDTRFIFDRHRGTLTHTRLLRRRRTWPLADVERVEMFQAWSRYQDCKLVFKDGSRLRIARGRTTAALRLAQRIATFLTVPCDVRELP